MVLLNNSYDKASKASPLDFLTRIENIINETGCVVSLYGGFKITVQDSTNFPWSKLLTLLVELDHEIWIEKESKYLVIKSKPPSI